MEQVPETLQKRHINALVSCFSFVVQGKNLQNVKIVFRLYFFLKKIAVVQIFRMLQVENFQYCKCCSAILEFQDYSDFKCCNISEAFKGVRS